MQRSHRTGERRQDALSQTVCHAWAMRGNDLVGGLLPYLRTGDFFQGHGIHTSKNVQYIVQNCAKALRYTIQMLK